MKKLVLVAALLVGSFSFADEQRSLFDADIVADVLTHGKEAFDQYRKTGSVERFTIAEIVGHIVIEADQRSLQMTPPLLAAAFHTWGVYDQFQTSRARLAVVMAGVTVPGLLFLSASAYAAYSHAHELYETLSTLLWPQDYGTLFKKGIRNLIENMDIKEEEVRALITPDFQQWVDGKRVDRDAFIHHIMELKKHMVAAKVDFKEVIAKGNVVSAIHEVYVTKSDGSASVFKVIGHATFDGDKLAKVDELTFQISGDTGDRDLGSIQ